MKIECALKGEILQVVGGISPFVFSQWVQMVVSILAENKQDLRINYIQIFLQEKSVLNDSISNKSDKCKDAINW